MNLVYAHRLMGAAARQENARLSVTNRSERKELQEMADAGLVEITAEGSDAEPALRLERLTDLGRTFLRAFRTEAPGTAFPITVEKRIESQERADSSAASVSKWRNKFLVMQLDGIR
jgi:DNA-binding PadR family transcriptional regulator